MLKSKTENNIIQFKYLKMPPFFGQRYKIALVANDYISKIKDTLAILFLLFQCLDMN